MIVLKNLREEAIGVSRVKLASSKDFEGFIDGTEYSLHV